MVKRNKWYKDKVLWLILLLGLVIRVIFIFYSPPILFDAKDYDALGKSISEGKGFNIEGINNTPYLGIRPPGYPLFLGGIYYLFGYNHLAVYVVQIFLDLSILLMLYMFLERLYPKENYKYLIAFLWSINPMSTYYSVSVLSEILYLFLFALAFYIFYWKIFQDKKFIYILPLSLILGYASLIKSFLVYVYVLFFVLTIYFFFHGRYFRKHRKSWKPFIALLTISLLLFVMLFSAFIIRNYYLFNKPINYEVGKSLAFTGGNPNMFTSEDNAYLQKLIQDEYKNFTPMQALENSKIVVGYFNTKVSENPMLFISNSLIRASLFWFEPFGVRYLFMLQGGEGATDKTYTPSFSFIQNYGVAGFFHGISTLILALLILILLIWLSFLTLSIFGLYLMFFKYNQKLLVSIIIVLCVFFTGIYALTVVVPRYFIQNVFLLIIPLSVGLSKAYLYILKRSELRIRK